MDTEQQLIYDSLDIILRDRILKEELGSEEFYALTDQVEAMKDRYIAAKAVADDKSADAKQREYAKALCASLAKGIPDMTKAAINAAAAFRKGDSITGSAAVMDMCAAIAPIIGTILSAGPLLGALGGPIGMAAGALFSLVSQLLMMFAPKGDSMLDQIERLLDKMDQEAELLDIKAVQAGFTAYSKDLRQQARQLRDTLKRPIATDADYLFFDREIVKMKQILKVGNPHQNVRNFTTWRVLEWLKMPEKQDLDRWPEILGVYCKVYTDLLTSNMMIALVMSSEDMQKRVLEVSSTGTAALPVDKKQHLEQELNHLKAYAEGYAQAYAACNAVALLALREITPIARNRGIFFLLIDGQMRSGSGKNVIDKDKWSPDFWGYCRRFSVTLSKEDGDPFNPPLSPRYHFWALESSHISGTDAIWHSRLDSRKLADLSASRNSMVLGEGTLRGGASEFSDISAVPAPDGHGEYVFCSRGNWAQGGDLQAFQLDEKNAFSVISWRPGTKSQLLKLRVVTPFLTLADDPDRDAMPPYLLPSSDQSGSIVYGALKNSSDIYVDRNNERCYVPSPVPSYSGVAADSRLVWVWGPGGCCCASHASIMSFLAGTRPAPLWMSLSLDSLLYDGDQHSGADSNYWTGATTRPPLRGLRELSSCEDNTLFISLDTRKISRAQTLTRWEFTAHDSNALYTTTYIPDFKNRGVATGAWTKFKGGIGASQVQKLPIPCWNLLDSLNADLAPRIKVAGA